MKDVEGNQRWQYYRGATGRLDCSEIPLLHRPCASTQKGRLECLKCTVRKKIRVQRKFQHTTVNYGLFFQYVSELM